MSVVSTKFSLIIFYILVMNKQRLMLANVHSEKSTPRRLVIHLVYDRADCLSWESCNMHESQLALADHLGFVRRSILQPDYVRGCVGLNGLTNGPGYWRLRCTQVVTPNSKYLSSIMHLLLWHISLQQKIVIKFWVQLVWTPTTQLCWLEIVNELYHHLPSAAH